MTQPTISKERAAEIKRKFPHFPECTDTTAKRREYILRLPKFAEDFLIEHVVHVRFILPELCAASNFYILHLEGFPGY